ncbi:MAG: Gfo/Idh/MocA family protein [Candidatus Zipacnadales bacterium]
MATARIAFVGAGSHSTQALYPCIAHIPEFDLVAVCDLDREKAQRAARSFGARQAYTDLDKMLNETEPDGVCICGMPDMHHTVGLECLRRGIPVWMEKPPAWHLAESLELVEIAREHNTWGMVGFMKRFAPANRIAKEYLDSGELGPLSSITLLHGTGKYEEFRRMLLFNGIHMIDLGCFLAGTWGQVFAFGTQTTAGTQAISVVFTLVSGAVGQLNLNSAHTWQDTFEQVYLTGSEGGLHLEASRDLEIMSHKRRFAEGKGAITFGWSSRYYTSHNLSSWWSSGHYTKGYWGELNHFVQTVLGNVEPRATLEDGAQDMRIIEAILLSVERGEPVTLADVEPE